VRSCADSPYQLYRIALVPSTWLIALTIFDAFVVWLTWREWRKQRRKAATASVHSRPLVKALRSPSHSNQNRVLRWVASELVHGPRYVTGDRDLPRRHTVRRGYMGDRDRRESEQPHPRAGIDLCLEKPLLGSHWPIGVSGSVGLASPADAERTSAEDHRFRRRPH